MQLTEDGAAPRPKQRLSLVHSVGSRLFLSVVAGSLVGVIGTAYLTYWELLKQSEAELHSSLQVKAKGIEGSLNSFETSTHLVRDAIQTLYTAGERREPVYVALIQRALETSPLGTGLGFGQPPNQRRLIPARRYAYPFAIREPNGKVVAKGGETDPADYEQDYFTRPIRLGKPLWLEPVSYTETTVTPPRTIVSTSYTLPFYTAKHQLLGVLSHDMELGFLSRQLNVPVMRERGNFMLLSAQGNLIAYPPDPNQALELKPFSGLNNYLELWTRVQSELKSGQSGGVLHWRDRDGNANYWAYEQISSNGWVLMAVVPESVVLGPVVRFTAIAAIGSIVGVSVVLGAVVFLFVRRLNQRLKPIMDECQRLSEMNAKSEELMSREDELGRLTISFYALLGQVTVNERRLRQEMAKSAEALQALQRTQAQLIQTEKMSSLGQMVAGVAHEINNPINFIYGNLPHATNYTKDLLHLIDLYKAKYPDPDADIQAYQDDIDLDFLVADLQKMLHSMSIGADRIREIVLSLRNFSRLDEAEMKQVNIHDGIDSTLLILQNRLKSSSTHSEIEVVKEYGTLPLVDCYPGQLNQVFMNILSNAIDALDAWDQKRSPAEQQANPASITIRTQVIEPHVAVPSLETASISRIKPHISTQSVAISIRDNGPGIPPKHLSKLFDPFFTTKPVGKGTGLGLSISYQIIVDKHNGILKCSSEVGQGAEFWIEIPVKQAEPLLLPGG